MEKLADLINAGHDEFDLVELHGAHLEALLKALDGLKEWTEEISDLVFDWRKASLSHPRQSDWENGHAQRRMGHKRPDGAAGNKPGRKRSRTKERSEQNALKNAASPLLEVHLEFTPSGWAKVTLDRGVPISLPPQVAILFDFAVSGPRYVPDGLPSFISVRWLRENVPQFAGSRMTQLIHRIREYLSAWGYNRYLLETDRRADGLYLRFRARRLVVSGCVSQWKGRLPVARWTHSGSA